MESERIKYRGYTIKIMTDEDPQNPRTAWDNLGHMVCFHNRYNLGDEKHDFKEPEDFKEFLEAYQGKIVALPLFLYDHSGITIRTRSFSDIDPGCWDSGCVGYIYLTYPEIRKEYGWRVVNKARIKKIEEYLRAEVETYDDYLTGSVYGYQIIDPKGNEVDDGSCWGYYGYDHKKSGLMDQAEDAVNCEIKSRQKKLTSKVKALIKNHVPLEARVAQLAAI